jgi:hypothetical protein
MNSEIFHAGPLTLKQELAIEGNIGKLCPDVAICVVSWEKRASSLSRMLSSWPGVVDILRFKSFDDTTEKRKDVVQKEIVTHLPRHKLLPLDSAIEFRKNANSIETLIREHYARVRRPLRILVDVSCLPKNYILFLLGLGFRREFVGRFDLLYSEGRYHYETESPTRPTTSQNLRGVISDGEWTSLQIPYLEGRQYIPEVRDLIASLGGELTLSVPFIQRFEPRRLDLLMITHNKERMEVSREDREKRALSELESQPQTKKTSFDIEDVIGVARHAINFCRESISTPTTALAIGPKTHAIALGVAAMYVPEMEIVCRIPSSYIPSDVDATGRSFHYSIEDRFEPYAYLTNALV